MANKIKIKLAERYVELLSNLPEQGMGYQIVDVTLKNGKILKEKVVFNSTYLQLDNGERIENENIDSIKIHEK